ncbi:MAG: TonB-dependent receptor [Acidobacteriota bacterium]|nr:TonB-dependent receptor [Acidobacteriota bacterium]
MKKVFFPCLVFLLLVSFGFSQTGQVGNIQGTVFDENRVPLPGVTVTISSPALVIGQMSRVTSANGNYRFPSIPPGEYEIKYELQGFKTVVRKGIVVSAASTATVDVAMPIATIEEEVVVEGVSPTIDKVKTTKTAKIDENFILSIPATRTLGTYFNMTPGVTGDAAHGSSVRDNTYNIDGVNTSDPVVGTESIFFSVDTVEEISVQTGGLPAEYGQVQGAVIDVVSKSGGNEFHGSANFYYKGEGFQSNNTRGTPLEGMKSGFKYEMEPGINVGGPIIKDKLWFFLNASLWKQEAIVSGYPYDKPGNETGVDQLRPYPYIKLTFQPNQDNKLIATYRYSDLKRNHRGASRYMTEDTTWKQKTATHVFNLQYTRFFGSSFFMNIKGFAYLSQFDLLAKNDQPMYYDAYNYRRSGSYGYSDLNPRDRYSIAADGTLFLENLAGNHEIKFGAEYMLGKGGRTMNFNNHPGNPYTANGYNLYFIEDLHFDPWYYVEWYAPYDVKEESRNFSAFVQDAWAVNKRLTFNLGLRFERMKGVIPPQMQDEGDKTLPLPAPYDHITYNRAVTETITAYTWNTLSPRLGLVFDLTGDGKTAFKASFSRYYLANLTQWVSRGNPNGFVFFAGFVEYDEATDTFSPLSDPSDITGYMVAGPEYVPKYGYGDYKFKTPYTDELVVGLEREIFKNTSFGVRYIRKWSRNNIEDADASYLNLDSLLASGEYEWLNYEEWPVTDPYDGQERKFYNRTDLLTSEYYMINPPDANRNYDGVEVTIDKRYANNWQLQVSYVWQKSRGLIATDFDSTWSGTGLYDNPNAHINAIGRFPDERRNQIKIEGMVKLPWDINVGGYMRLMSGRRYARAITSTFFVDDTLPEGTPWQTDLSQGGTTIYAEPSGSRALPEVAILDLRIEKRFRISRTSFGIFADIFNVFNDSRATSLTTVSNNTSIAFRTIQSITDPRILQLGCHFEW